MLTAGKVTTESLYTALILEQQKMIKELITIISNKTSYKIL